MWRAEWRRSRQTAARRADSTEISSLSFDADDARHLVDGGQPVREEQRRIALQVDHATGERRRVDLLGQRTSTDHLAQLRVHLHHFVDPDAAFQTLSVA